MPLQGDNNIFCALQIFPATRAEAVLFCFSSQELIAHECSGDVLINFSLCLGCFRVLDFVETPFVYSVCSKNKLKLEAQEVLLQNLCESSLGKAIIRRYVELWSAHAIAYSVEKQKIPSRLRC